METMYINPDNSYKTEYDFDTVLGLLNDFIKDDEYKKDMILMIQVIDGVFIRTKDEDWCRFFDDYCLMNQEHGFLYPISFDEWKSITKKHKFPIKSFGDEGLAIWRVGY